MHIRKSILVSLLVCAPALAGILQNAAPTVTLSPNRILRGGIVQMKGAGFTPKAGIISHLRRPDGSEFPTLPMMSNDRGEIAHEIETYILEPGVYEVWVEDKTAKKTSTPVRLEVTRT
jgi:hypothetical protein